MMAKVLRACLLDLQCCLRYVLARESIFGGPVTLPVNEANQRTVLLNCSLCDLERETCTSIH